MMWVEQAESSMGGVWYDEKSEIISRRQRITQINLFIIITLYSANEWAIWLSFALN